MGKKVLTVVEGVQAPIRRQYAPRSNTRTKRKTLTSEEVSLINIIKRAKQYTSVFAVGDTHGKTAELGFRIKQRYQIKNSIMFLCGDCGIGFSKLNYHIEEFKKLNTVAKINNNIIIVIRGNHDDPSYFTGSFNKFSNVVFVPDYTVIETGIGKVLCVGGGISIDRTWRTIGKTYWEDEIPIYDEEKLKTIGKVDIVMTHAAPAFCEPIDKDGIESWLLKDPDLHQDCDYERKVFTDIYNYLKDNGSDIQYWCYGHYHMTQKQKHEDTLFRACDELEFYQIPYDSPYLDE